MPLSYLLVMAVLGLAPAAGPGPLEQGQVAADATWLVHLDVDAMRASSLVQKVAQKALDTNNLVRRQLDLLPALIGMDVRKDLHAITLYGKRLGKNEGVLLIRANVDRKFLLDKVKSAPDHQATTYRSYELHSWTDGKGKKEERAVAGAFHSASTAVFAPSVEELKQALDVLDGRRESLAAKKSLLAAAVPPGTMAVARVTGLAQAELPYKSPLVTQCESLDLAFGEHEGTLFAQAKLRTKSPETSTQVQSILEGLRAMAQLQQGKDPAAAKLLQAVKFSKTDRTVEMDFRAPVDEIWAQVEKSWQRLPGGAAKGR